MELNIIRNEKRMVIGPEGRLDTMTAQKSMNGKGSMVITGCSSDILEIFDTTVSSAILTMREE